MLTNFALSDSVSLLERTAKSSVFNVNHRAGNTPKWMLARLNCPPGRKCLMWPHMLDNGRKAGLPQLNVHSTLSSSAWLPDLHDRAVSRWEGNILVVENGTCPTCGTRLTRADWKCPSCGECEFFKFTFNRRQPCSHCHGRGRGFMLRKCYYCAGSGQQEIYDKIDLRTGEKAGEYSLESPGSYLPYS